MIMGDTHLDELRKALERKGWKVLSQGDGDSYRISAVWRVQRSNNAEVTELLFEGFDDLKVLPVAQSYACRVKDKREVSIYLGSMKEFKKALPGFISELDALEDAKKNV
jgi:hypothetical protein